MDVAQQVFMSVVPDGLPVPLPGTGGEQEHTEIREINCCYLKNNNV